MTISPENYSSIQRTTASENHWSIMRACGLFHWRITWSMFLYSTLLQFHLKICGLFPLPRTKLTAVLKNCEVDTFCKEHALSSCFENQLGTLSQIKLFHNAKDSILPIKAASCPSSQASILSMKAASCRSSQASCTVKHPSWEFPQHIWHQNYHWQWILIRP